ncbi:MAG: hypothetical protein AAFX09_11560 [Pseudomonadota bacterium]
MTELAAITAPPEPNAFTASVLLHNLNDRYPPTKPDRALSREELRVLDWLQTQKRAVAFWLDEAIAANGDMQLVEALERHAGFLDDALNALALRGRL